MNILIGVAGKPRSGKDSIGVHLEEHHGFFRYAFADYLKWIAVEYFGFSKEELWGEKTEESRKFLQELGRFCTDIDTNFFVSKVVKKIKVDYEKCKRDGIPFSAVITDVRREDELKLFDRNSTFFLTYDEIMNSGISMKNAFDKIVLVKVERPLEIILQEEPGLEENMKHPVEQLTNNYDKWDYLISNNEGMDVLKSHVDRLVLDLKEDSNNDLNKREVV